MADKQLKLIQNYKIHVLAGSNHVHVWTCMNSLQQNKRMLGLLLSLEAELIYGH